MDLEPGDMQFVYNHALLHDRTGFVDHPDPDERRHLLRLWLTLPGDRELPPVFAQRYGSLTIGDRGGIIVSDTDLCVPLDVQTFGLNSQSSAEGRRRPRLRSPRRRLASSRRRLLERVTFVGRRERSTRPAAPTRARNRSMAIARFRCCERSSSTTTRTTGPSLAMTRRRSASGMAAEPSMSKVASTRVFDRLAC